MINVYICLLYVYSHFPPPFNEPFGHRSTSPCRTGGPFSFTRSLIPLAILKGNITMAMGFWGTHHGPLWQTHIVFFFGASFKEALHGSNGWWWCLKQQSKEFETAQINPPKKSIMNLWKNQEYACDLNFITVLYQWSLLKSLRNIPIGEMQSPCLIVESSTSPQPF